MVKKKSKIALFIAIPLVIIMIAVSGFFFFSQTALPTEKFGDCQSQSDCLDILIAADMPDNYLKQNNIEIECVTKRCIAKEK